ncbi:MAG: chromosome segregation protein SMC [Christensenellales bacterium]
MNFKRLEVVGFKSFADKTVIEFDGGITGIVGPNGCGKSNVADSIRWVLGEQSSKLLRGSSMQDVIFAGTENRKSLSYAEVTMVLDNSDRTLNIDYNEVSITRKLYRNGDSEYILNNTPCRLKDIIDILHDSGIGRDGYSIIGQGKVDEIVNSKPENRRIIFEEAAGISKFKAKKVEASRKLERTRENLSRLRDILAEIERQLTPLKNQAENAKKYLILKENLKKAEINNYIYQYDNASNNKEAINIKIRAISEELDNRNHDLEVVVKKYNENFEKIQNIDKDINALYQKMIELNVKLEKSSSEASVINEKMSAVINEINRLNEETNRISASIISYKNELENITKIKDENNGKISKLNEEIEGARNHYLSIVDKLAKSEDLSEENQREMVNALSKLSDYKSELSKKTTEKENLSSRLDEITTLLNEETIKNSTINSQISKLIEEENEMTASKNQIKVETSACLNKYNESLLKLRLTEDKIGNLLNSIAILDSRKKVLTEMQKDLEGFNNSVKNLIKHSETNQNLKKQFIGVVANLMEVPKIYETAVEMALGGAIQNIVTENEQNANSLIDYLKQNSLGRATFLPLTSVKSREIEERYLTKLKINGCYGIASKLIKFDKKLQNIFESLLGATVIVNDLPLAISLAKECNYSFRIVTLDGDIINPAGSISGGSKKNSVSNLIGRSREIDEIELHLNKLNSELAENKTLKENLDNTCTTLQDKIKENNNKIHELEMNSALNNEKIESLKKSCDESKTIIESHKNNVETINSSIAVIENDIFTLEATINSINTNRTSTNEAISKTQEQFSNLKEERDRYNEKITAFRVEIATINSNNLALNNDEIRLQKEIEEKNKNLLEISENLSKISAQKQSLENKLEQVKQNETYKACQKEINTVKEKLDSLDEYKQNLQLHIKELEEDRMNFSNQIVKLQNKKNQEELNLTKIDTELENMQERIWEEYELTYASSLEYKIENYNLEEGLIEANKNKREIDKLGYVNVNAIEESVVIQERYETLNEQVLDLTKAEEDTSKVIKELNSEMVNRFTSEFEKINDNFKKVFKELFGGGRAELVLVKPEIEDEETGEKVCDILDAGVDIIAEPPGKSLKNLSLLSGGEKALTAIAILFAILKLKPMPFCLLDEIEAALDDANVGRFAKYLNRFSSETQFIVITHRKPTMELADRLYGVTMQEKGVSKIVSVKLNDVEID